jgi:hypothetical protein
MRLRLPRVNRVESHDGKASLEYVGLDMSRDGGGVYRFELARRAGTLVVERAIVASVTPLYARDYAFENGVAYDDLTLTEAMSFSESYAEKYGHTHVVKEFDLPWKGFWKSQVNSIIDSFCCLYFEMNSSYRNNNTDVSAENAGAMYPDTITFSPYELDRRYHVKKKAA